jgi:hypothetical protein
MAVSGGERGDPGPETDAPGNSTSPDRTAESYQDPDTYEDHANPEVTSPEQEANLESGERLRRLLQAYKDTLNTVKALPMVVWVPWDRTGLGRYFKVPYLRLFLKYFVVHHIDRSLNTLNRCFLETAALSSDPDANRTSREAVTLYLQSLPRLPYRVLIFAAILAALVIALPLQAFGNVFYVLDLAGALLRSDVTDVGRTFTGNDLELPSIGWQLFVLSSSRSDSTAFPSFLDTYATHLLTEPLSTVKADGFQYKTQAAVVTNRLSSSRSVLKDR